MSAQTLLPRILLDRTPRLARAVTVAVTVLMFTFVTACDDDDTGDTGNTNNATNVNNVNNANNANNVNNISNTTNTAAPDTIISSGETMDLSVTWVGQATSFSDRGDDSYAVGYFVNDGVVVGGYSLLAEEDVSVSELVFDVMANGLGFDALIAHGASSRVTVTGTLNAMDEGDGSGVSDFSGLGSMIVASDYATVTVDSMDIITSGFARAAFIADDHANILVKKSQVTTWGANPLTDAYASYVNSANTSIMISPPWVLGIQGGVRAANMLGERASLSVVDSEITSASWAVLSTDSCTSPQMTVVDSDLTILPEASGGMSSGPFSYGAAYGSGYGTYVIGSANQDIYGAHYQGMTYAAIFTGGTATYRSSTGTIDLTDANGTVLDTVEGAGRPTVINSVWGFMAHNTAELNVLDNTEVNAEEAIFLHKAGAATILFDAAVLSSGSGVILQMIDNDDTLVGGSMDAFNTTFSEDAGWPSENGNVTSGSGTSQNSASVTLRNGTYTGDLFNGTGYYGITGGAMTVIIGESATLTGAISLTETRHVDENGDQNTAFTIDEYYYLGHVANRAYRNQSSQAAVTVDDGGVWEVTGECYLTALTLGDGEIVGAGGATVVLTVDGVETALAAGTYSGEIVLSLQ